LCRYWIQTGSHVPLLAIQIVIVIIFEVRQDLGTCCMSCCMQFVIVAY
jgi:hypothetical protein